jgi:hypothetical protein
MPASLCRYKGVCCPKTLLLRSSSFILFWALFGVFLFTATLAQGQAGVLPMHYNPEQGARWLQLQEYRAWHKEDKGTKPTGTNQLPLPFLDDFSNSFSVPDSTRWLKNSGVYVNNRYGHKPPSTGVASFDGIKANGQPYNANLKAKGACDTLTSQPIALGSVPANKRGTVFLSYFLQTGHPEVNVFRPDTTDSLLVQVFNPASARWYTAATHYGGTTNNRFLYQYVDIADSLLQDGFQFRFLNFGFQNNTFSLWNIDYVYLDADRIAGDSAIADVAFSGLLPGYFKGYRAIPADHYNKKLLTALTDGLEGQITNLGSGTVVFNGLNVTADSVGGDGKYDNGSLLNIPLTTRVLGGVNDGGNTFAPRVSADTLAAVNQGKPFAETGRFRYKMAYVYANADFNKIPTNDTLAGEATLADYYAADDGTGEVVEYVTGNFASMVVRVQPADTGKLTGIAFYFDPKSFEVNLNLTARLLVYKKLRGVDGATDDEALSISSIALLPNGGKWYFFPLSRPVAVGPEPYYIGYKQDAGDDNRLFLRADINSGQASVYANYASSGGWVQNPILIGQPMVRPYYQCSLCPVAVQPKLARVPLVVVPNPAQAGQEVRLGGLFDSATLLSMDGRKTNAQLRRSDASSYAILPAGLPPGVYMLQAQGRQTIGMARIVIH